jgi:cation diffusion facilitator family transporter
MTPRSSHEGHKHHHDGEHDSHDSSDASDSHAHNSHGAHGHTHGSVDPSISSNERGLWAVKWGFVGLFLTASVQLVVVFLSHSVALLADTIHNFGDAGTAIPLGIAFLFARHAATRRFTYGFGRVEDLAGLAVVLTIFASAGVAFYQAINRLIHPQAVSHIGAIIGASIIGFLGNELVAVFRIRVGKEIGSAALIADGYHARTDGWTSLAVLAGALGVYFGYPKADPIIGLLITVAILGIVWQSAKLVFARMLDGVEPNLLDEVKHSAGHVHGVDGVSDVRARWIGHTLRAEVSITVDPHLTVQQGHDLAKRVEHEMVDHLKFLSGVTIHVDPASEAGEKYHRVEPDEGATATVHTH